jgi:DNA-binding MarR family transcriptional regulator
MATTQRLAARLMHVMPLVGGAMARAIRDGHGSTDANSLVQLHTMNMLAHGPLTFKALCAGRGVAAPTLSRSINALVRRGWVAREPDPQDKRKLTLTLTPEGYAHLHDVTGNAQRALAGKLKPLSAQDRQKVMDALDLLASTLNQTHA